LTNSHQKLLLRRWAFELLRQKRYDEAAVIAEVICDKTPHLAILDFAEQILGTDYRLQGVEFLNFILGANTTLARVNRFEIYQLMARLLAAQGDTELAVKYMYKALKQLPNRKQYKKIRHAVQYQLGSLLSANGDLEKAQKLFDKGIPVTCGNGWITSSKVVNFNTIKAQLKLPSIQSKMLYNGYTKDTKPKLVYLVSADILYSRKFVPSLLKTMESLNQKDIHIHLHGISVNETTLNKQAWLVLKQSIEHLNISFSMTWSSVTSSILKTEISKKSIYSFERFRILPRILKLYEVPVIVADIDQIPLRSPIALVDNDFDIALLRFPEANLNILSLISATLSIFKPTKEGLLAAKMLKKYFENALTDRAALTWHIDQAGLAVLDYTNQKAKIYYLDTSLVITNPKQYTLEEACKSGAFFWSVTNSLNSEIDHLNILS